MNVWWQIYYEGLQSEGLNQACSVWVESFHTMWPPSEWTHDHKASLVHLDPQSWKSREELKKLKMQTTSCSWCFLGWSNWNAQYSSVFRYFRLYTYQTNLGVFIPPIRPCHARFLQASIWPWVKKITFWTLRPSSWNVFQIKHVSCDIFYCLKESSRKIVIAGHIFRIYF